MQMRLTCRNLKRYHFETAIKVNVCITKPSWSLVAAPFVCSSLPVSLFSSAVWRQTMKMFLVFFSPGLQLSERINKTFTLEREKIQWPSSNFQWFKVMLSMYISLHCLHSKCYCNRDIWHVFCWHLFSLLFHVNKVLWDPGILLPPLLYPFEKDSHLLQDFLLVFKPASCQPGWAALSDKWRVWWPYAFILIRMKLEWTDNIEPEQ